MPVVRSVKASSPRWDAMNESVTEYEPDQSVQYLELNIACDAVARPARAPELS
jgi:hypothetical protein